MDTLQLAEAEIVKIVSDSVGTATFNLDRLPTITGQTGTFNYLLSECTQLSSTIPSGTILYTASVIIKTGLHASICLMLPKVVTQVLSLLEQSILPYLL